MLEIREIQTSTDGLVNNVKQLDNDIESFMFNEAKKDKVAKEIYKEIQTLKDDFDKLITGLQEKGKIQASIREVE